MSAVQRRTKRLGPVISICVLTILFLIGAGVFLKQFHYDMSRFGINAITEPEFNIRNSKFEIPFDLSSLAPAGFKTLSKTEMYDSGNLYEKINGKAPLYIESGFEKLSTQRFVNKDDESLMMELYVYDMGNIRNAFSVYSVQRRAEAEILPDMQFGYRTGNALYFVYGEYYIELVGFSESDELFKAMTEISDKLREKLAVDKVTDIAELGLFPSENIIPGSAKLYLSSAFGFEGLTDTFTAPYKFGDEIITAFLSKRPDKQNAQTIAESYYNFLIDNGGKAKTATNEILKGKVVDFYNSTEIVCPVGPFVAGIHEADSQPLAEKLAVTLINKLSKVTKAVSNDRKEQ